MRRHEDGAKLMVYSIDQTCDMLIHVFRVTKNKGLRAQSLRSVVTTTAGFTLKDHWQAHSDGTS